jgi:hypothetical protein
MHRKVPILASGTTTSYVDSDPVGSETFGPYRIPDLNPRPDTTPVTRKSVHLMQFYTSKYSSLLAYMSLRKTVKSGYKLILSHTYFVFF